MYARFQLYGMVLAALAMVNLAPSLGVPHIAPEFETLPDELKLSVMEQLPLADAARFGRTSSSNYNIFQSDILGMKTFNRTNPHGQVSIDGYHEVLRARDAMGMLPSGQPKESAVLFSSQQLQHLLNYYKPSLRSMLATLWIMGPASETPTYRLRQFPPKQVYPDLVQSHQAPSENADDRSQVYLKEFLLPRYWPLETVTTGLMGLANKRLYHEAWLFIQQYFQIIENPSLNVTMSELDDDPLAHVLSIWVGENNAARLRYYLINHMLYFVMPGLIAACIVNGDLQAVEALIDNVMGFRQARDWMGQSEAHRIDYYGFAIWMAAYVGDDSEDLRGFLQTMSQKPGADVQKFLDCMIYSDRKNEIKSIFQTQFEITRQERGDLECESFRQKFDRTLFFFEGISYLHVKIQKSHSNSNNA